MYCRVELMSFYNAFPPSQLAAYIRRIIIISFDSMEVFHFSAVCSRSRSCSFVFFAVPIQQQTAKNGALQKTPSRWHNNCCQAQITLSFPVILMLFSGFTSYFSVSLSCQAKIYRCHNFAPSLRQKQTQMSECI